MIGGRHPGAADSLKSFLSNKLLTSELRSSPCSFSRHAFRYRARRRQPCHDELLSIAERAAKSPAKDPPRVRTVSLCLLRPYSVLRKTRCATWVLAAVWLIALAVPSVLAQSKAETAQVSASTPVLISRTGTKYHREGCSTLRNGGISTTLGEASTRGEPCKVCRPPVLISTAAPAAPAPAAPATAVSAQTPPASTQESFARSPWVSPMATRFLSCRKVGLCACGWMVSTGLRGARTSASAQCSSPWTCHSGRTR